MLTEPTQVLKTIRLILATAFLFLAGAFAAPASTGTRSSLYLYEDTRQLVALVESAANAVESTGHDAFREFAVAGSKWLNDTYYIFIYDLDGTCVFHPITPQLNGTNLMHLKDMNGKPVIRLITDIARKPERQASGWVFYLWEERTQFTPMWKSSYIRKAIAPDGKIYAVGCGVYSIKMERAFIKERVDLAAGLLSRQGTEIAFAQLRDTATPFYFLDTYVFVMNDKGESVVDPAFPGMQRDLKGFKDAIGRPVVEEMLQKLEKNDEAWVQYMWPKPGAILPSRKVAYIRKVRSGANAYLVGADYFLASPIWMKM
jgi:signal transduction histidine kinase